MLDANYICTPTRHRVRLVDTWDQLLFIDVPIPGPLLDDVDAKILL